MTSTRERDAELLVVAGEPSGDRAAARVVEALRDAASSVFGIGGDHLAAAGVELLADIRDLTALGIGDALSRLGAWGRAWCLVREHALRRRPRVALLVDTPEINLPLARALTTDGIRVVWYIGPQVWAWRPGRLGLLRERTEVVALVLPFEREIYDQARVHAVHVGHPLLDEPAGRSCSEVRSILSLREETPLLALLPGSRGAEVANLAGPMIDAGDRLLDDGVQSVIAPGPGTIDRELVERARAAGIILSPEELSARELLDAADAAVVASGTATLEAAVAGTPLAVVYRVGPLSWLAARLLVDVPYIGLPNWVAGRRVVPELLQDEVSGAALAEMARALLEPAERERQRGELAEVGASLGTPGAAVRVARLVRERLS